jgi:histone deacetylase 11
MESINPKIISSPDYDINFFGVERLHPFDSRKYGRAWQSLRRQYGDEILWRTIQPEVEISHMDLLAVHTPEYLESLKAPAVIARALEMVMLSSVPFPLLKSRLLYPMRLAVQGTVIAAVEALQSGLTVNLSGGYHHATAAAGGGFCLYADVPLAIETLRADRLLDADQQAVIIDLDAHQGNGFERVYHGADGVFIFDMYNQAIYPNDEYAKQRIDYAVGVNSGCSTDSYLDLLYRKLPEALDRVKNPGIAFYIAGTDIVKGDPLGNLKVSENGVFLRDRFVIDQFVKRDIPLVIVLGGGYTRVSFRMIARMVGYIVERWGDTASTTITG